MPEEEASGSQIVRLAEKAHPVLRKPKIDPSLPTLNEQERALLTFISEHPDAPVSSVYKGMGVSVWKGNEIRERLKALGLLVELELRTGTTGAGRPMKCILPTLQALELLEIAPPPGRGGAVHRHIQQIIKDGATNKGYSAQVEKELPTGAIVDVHLEKGTERIAVEVAVASIPEREVSHMKHCISDGYDHVYVIFLDESLLQKTATAIQGTLSQEEAGKVRLLPFSQLAQVG
jgi:hypothetical protein